MRDGVLVLGHGSRDPAGNQELEAFARAIAAARPEECVRHGYIELAAPLFAEALDALAAECERVVVLPLFLLAAGHVKDDVPRVLAEARRRRPGVTFIAARPLGVDRAMLEIAGDRLDGAVAGAEDGTAVVIVGRGSSDPDANGDLFKVARLLVDGRPFLTAQACFAGIRRPFLPETLDLVARLAPRRIVVVPYVLFAGRILTRLRDELAAFGARAPGLEAILTPPLGAPGRLLALAQERIEGAGRGRDVLPCDTCPRGPVPGVEARPADAGLAGPDRQRSRA